MKTLKGICFVAIILCLAGAARAQGQGNKGKDNPGQEGKESSNSIETERYEPKVLIKGKWGDKPGEFGLGSAMGEEGGDVIPDEIVSDDVGSIYVLDNWNNRIQKFDANGKYLEAYPLEIYVNPTNNEFEQSIKAWNKRMNGFIKVRSKKLAWINGQLHIHQKRMPDVRANKYEDNMLVMKSGKFVKATEKTRGEYEGIKQWEKSDDKGNRYAAGRRGWEKFDKNGEKIFEFPIDNEHKFGTGTLGFRSVVFFDKRGDCFLELRPFSLDDADWARVYMPDGGGMLVTRWCKK